MADNSVFRTNKLGQLATPKKSATVEAAFDSDESDWSDDDGQLNSVVKQPVPLPTEIKIEKEELQNVSHNKASVNTLEPRRNSIQQDPSSSPYFINIAKDSRENASPSNLKQEPKKVASPVKTDVARSSVKKVDDNDDWDEESCINNQPVKKAENVFIEATTSVNKQHVSAPSTTSIKKPNMVDWSETYSAGGSGSEAEEVENPFDDENIQGEASSDHFMTKSDSLEKNESIETLEEKIDTISIKDDFDNHFIKKRGSISQNYVEPLDTRDESVAYNASPVLLKDNFSTTGEEDRYNPFNTLPSSSSAANLFIVPSSSTSALAPQFSKSSFDLTEASSQESSKQMKKTKPSSAKKLLSRFFSSDDEKSSKSKNDEPKSQSARKTSEPIPLSELLLGTPTPRVSNPPPIIPTRYFPQEASSSRMYHDLDQRGEISQGQPVPSVKRKGFFGKVKRTLGISSKSSKMRATASLKNLTPETPPTPVISDPCLSTEHAANNADPRVISVYTKGRPANEVLVDLLKEGKRYLESTQHSPNAGGEGGGGGDLPTFGKNEQPSNLGKLKKFSSLDLLSPTASKLTASETRYENCTQALFEFFIYLVFRFL